MKNKSYPEFYEDATKKMISLAQKIDDRSGLALNYSLPKITYILRDLYKQELFREKFVGIKLSDNKWSSGFCALASKAIYELHGADNLWDIMAIKKDDWERGPVIFLRDKISNEPFGTTGEHFYPLKIPYHLGFVLDSKRFKSPGSDEFINILKSKLERE